MKMKFMATAVATVTALALSSTSALACWGCDYDSNFAAESNMAVGVTVEAGVDPSVAWSRADVNDNKEVDTSTVVGEGYGSANGFGELNYDGNVMAKDRHFLALGTGGRGDITGNGTVSRNGHVLGYESVTVVTSGNAGGSGTVTDGRGMLVGSAYTHAGAGGDFEVQVPGRDSDNGYAYNFSGADMNGTSHAGDRGTAGLSNAVSSTSYSQVDTLEAN